MGTRSVALAILSLSIAISARGGDLDLTPRISTYELDGITFKQLSFSDGGSKPITYSPPDGWTYSGGASKLTLRPPNSQQIEATISRVKLSEPESIDEESVKKLADEVVASLPQGSIEVTVRSEEMDPVMINGKDTFLVTVSYTAFGQKFGRSAMLLNRGKEQIRFNLVSPWKDFPQAQRAFFASQFSWQNL